MPTIRIRPATLDDAPAVHDIYAPFVASTAVTFEDGEVSVSEVADRISDTLAQFPWLICERDGEVVGYTYGHSHRGRGGYRWSAETSVYVAENYRRQGIARGLYESLFAVLTAQNYVNCYAGIMIPNERSVGFHETMGFEPVGVYENVGYKLGEWQDTQWWHYLLREPPEEPDEPVPFSEIREDEKVRQASRRFGSQSSFAFTAASNSVWPRSVSMVNSGTLMG
ncbi:GNAT family N-acetyltransferase [Haloarchaeobius sp. DFWS5]|uniref:GNAT family N-acetyltransferase n=1 Tax=Haloarchaeobius sp. DFWS5 TaxID=3446114 RepID=UPI003EBAB498